MQPDLLTRTRNSPTRPNHPAAAPGPQGSSGKHRLPIILMHWGTLMAIVILVAAIWLREATEDDRARLWLMEIHRQLGMLVLIGVALRIAIRRHFGLAHYGPTMAAPLRWAAGLTQLALYGLSIALPMLGWAASSAHHVTLKLFGLVKLPELVAPNADLADTLSDYHSWAAWALLGMVSLHALASLWHHFVLRDPILSAMLPGRSRRSSTESS